MQPLMRQQTDRIEHR